MVPKPVVPYHAVLIGVHNGSGLKPVHSGERELDMRLHTVEEILGEMHPADVDRKAEFRRVPKIVPISLP
jgi:hypothetical protein